MSTIAEIEKTAQVIKKQITNQPMVGIILGSGLGDFTSDIDIEKVLPYNDIPGFPVSTVEGHKGNLVFGKLSGKNVVAMQGRFHYYEGYSMQEVVFPVRVMKYLGVKYLLVSNAAGGLNPSFSVGDLMVITDHINMFPENPLRGKNMSELGVRFPEMSQPWSEKLIKTAFTIAGEKGIKLQKGIYVGSSGPTLETRAEYKMFRLLGADATGMSTVPEVIAARHAGLECFGISVITNMAVTDQGEKGTSHDQVQDAAAIAQPNMTAIFSGVIQRIDG